MDSSSGAGRYAPSPSGDLHIGNLRTAVLAWLFARSTGRDFHLRIENLDRVKEGAQQRQLEDLVALGITFDGEPMVQSDRPATYLSVLESLIARELTFECFCTRREILDAPTAPHHPPGAYPGTCRDLAETERAAKRALRTPAIRLRSDVAEWTVHDELHGRYTGPVDDFVLQRTDGVVAYNLAVVVDDAAQGVDQVVRADDLLSSAPRQAYLAQLLGHDEPRYAHVPLVVNTAGDRLAKRDGAVTYRELVAHQVDPWALIAMSLGSTAPNLNELLREFDPGDIPREPWVFQAPDSSANNE